MSRVKIQLRKYNNASGQYSQYLTFEVEYGLIRKTLLEFQYGRTQSQGFYQYILTGVQLEESIEIYSVSPALFDHPEMHMT